MTSIKDILSALELKWPIALACLIGSTIIIGCHYYKIPYIKDFPLILIYICIILAIYTFSNLAVKILCIPAYIYRKYRLRRVKKKFLSHLEENVFNCSTEEIAVLEYLITTNRKAFTAIFGDRRLTPLVSKGFIIREGGRHPMLEWPYIVQDDVWDYLYKNKDKFHMQGASTMLDPFHWRNTPT
ncbi:hypothetical protein ACRC7T_01155 [Segnochrobactraceae bacterium EtOH-i3]